MKYFMLDVECNFYPFAGTTVWTIKRGGCGVNTYARNDVLHNSPREMSSFMSSLKFHFYGLSKSKKK